MPPALQRLRCYCSNNKKHICQHMRLDLNGSLLGGNGAAAPTLAQKANSSSTLPKNTMSSDANSSISYKSLRPSLAANDTQFVKVRRVGAAGGFAGRSATKVKRGLGHSQVMGTTQGNSHFSRRNSFATTITSAYLGGSDSSQGAGQPPKVRTASGVHGPSEFSEHRMHYERLKDEVTKLQNAAAATAAARRVCRCAVAGGKQYAGQLLQPAGGSIADDPLVALQRFRLDNLNDCFTPQRQVDLKMQAYVMSIRAESIVTRNDPTECNNELSKELTPLKIREEMRRLRGLPVVESNKIKSKLSKDQRIAARKEEKIMRAALEKSFALKFQETY